MDVAALDDLVEALRVGDHLGGVQRGPDVLDEAGLVLDAGGVAGLREHRPGGLARLLSEVGEAGANVIEVAHARINADLSLDEVQVHLQLETRGEAHAEMLLARLRERGYRVFE